VIEGVITKQLKVIPDSRGWLMEMMRADDPFFREFGQVYVTTCYPGAVKAWHYHLEQTDHWVVVSGDAQVALYDRRPGSPTEGELAEFYMGERNPILLVIPAGLLHGFAAVGGKPATVMNVPDKMYDREHPDEYRLPHDDPEVGYVWGIRQG
jgi:dTDP-4-dehydrorhamnose 3,5-epimerase